MDIYLRRIIHKAQYKIVKSEQYYNNIKEGYENGITWTFWSADMLMKLKHSS